MPSDDDRTSPVSSERERIHTARYGWSDLAFRILFSSIFLGLGAEHLFRDELLQILMPDWVPFPRLASVFCGIFLLLGAASILLGFHMKKGAFWLAVFLVMVTTAVHLPGLLLAPDAENSDYAKLWVMFQRSNFVKNVCLFGVCIHLMEHRPGRFSIDYKKEFGKRP